METVTHNSNLARGNLVDFPVWEVQNKLQVEKWIIVNIYYNFFAVFFCIFQTKYISICFENGMFEYVLIKGLGGYIVRWVAKKGDG
jgi:hypothetical protein